MSRDQIAAVTAATRAAWEASAQHHEASPDWAGLCAAAAQPGFSTLDQSLTATLKAQVAPGARAGQLCCNNARELLSLPSLGITPAWGVDGSEAFLAQARTLSELTGHAPRLVCCNAYDLPPDLEPVDLLLITIGVLNWMPDLPRFFAGAARTLAPGGVLVIYETHPVMEMFEPESDTPFLPAVSYFERDPYVETDAITYDGSVHSSSETSYWFQHTMGEIVTAVASAGLRIEALTELAHNIREPLYDPYEGQEAQIPMAFCLVARNV